MARCDKCDISVPDHLKYCPECTRLVNPMAAVLPVGKPIAPVYRAARPPAPNPEPTKGQRTIDVRALPPPPTPKPRTHTVPLTAISRPLGDPPKKVPPMAPPKPKTPALNLPKGVTKVWIELRVQIRLLRGENEPAAFKHTDAVLALACSKDGQKAIVLTQSARFPLVSPSVPTDAAKEALERLRALAVKHGLVEQRLPSGANWFSYRYDVPGQGRR